MKPLRIGLIGFGKTGQLVAKEIMTDAQTDLCWVFRKSEVKEPVWAGELLGFQEEVAPIYSIDSLPYEELSKSPVDVIIDFSSENTTERYPDFSKLGNTLVSAVSRYGDAGLASVESLSRQIPVMWSPNITLGINWLLVASRLLKQMIPHADIEIVEEHFRQKPEVSGTALRMAKKLDLDPKLHVNSIRVGGVIGKHEVIFGTPYQTIRLIHESVSRSAFGTGALFAAKWIHGKNAGLYNMEQAIQEMFLKKLSKISLE